MPLLKMKTLEPSLILPPTDAATPKMNISYPAGLVLVLDQEAWVNYFSLPLYWLPTPQWVTLDLHQLCRWCLSEEKKGAKRLPNEGIGSRAHHCRLSPSYSSPVPVFPPPYVLSGCCPIMFSVLHVAG